MSAERSAYHSARMAGCPNETLAKVFPEEHERWLRIREELGAERVRQDLRANRLFDPDEGHDLLDLIDRFLSAPKD